MKFLKININEIILIHDRIVEATGGSKGIRESNLLDSVCNTPFANYFGKELYPDIFLKAAVIINSLVNYHVFVDGNKRTGIAVMEYFLAKNGYNFTNSKNIKEDFVLHIATTNPDLADIAIWIKKHSTKF
jgi:death-on-curing protein